MTTNEQRLRQAPESTPAYGNEQRAAQVISDQRQEIICLKNVLEECDQLVVRVYEQIQQLVYNQTGDFISQTTKESLSICRKAQDEMRARIRDATGERKP